jgi:sulfate adenylyltransferase subunit 2
VPFIAEQRKLPGDSASYRYHQYAPEGSQPTAFENLNAVKGQREIPLWSFLFCGPKNWLRPLKFPYPRAPKKRLKLRHPLSVRPIRRHHSETRMAQPEKLMHSYNLTHLKQLEAESIHIIREVAAEFKKPVMLYSIGKDSAVMTHLALKAFYPSKPPFPFMHIDTTWKFKEMIQFRDTYVKNELGIELIVNINHEGLKLGIDPFDNSEKHTEVMKTDSLKSSLTRYGFDAAFGGARRDEEKSRAKERVFSFRDRFHRWDPKNQRPELWNLYNSRVNPGESIRVFPLSNWTELDVWQYIYLEKIPLPDLYLAKMRPVVERNGVLIHPNDDRFQLRPGEKIENRMVRFRTLGCWPLTGAVESNATTLPEIIQEMLLTKTSERQGRVIDKDSGGAGMELKKIQGYF